MREPVAPGGEGCLVVAVRLPVRIVVFVLVVPLRLAWDVLAAGGRLLHRSVLRPLGRALSWVGRAVFVWPFLALWRYVLVPVGAGLAWLARTLLVLPARWLYGRVLAPAGRGTARALRALGAGTAWVLRGAGTGLLWVLEGIGAGIAWVLRGVGAGLVWVYARALTPCGHAVAWLVRWLVVVPARWVGRYLLLPAGRGLVLGVRGTGWLLRKALAGIGFLLYWTGRLLFVLPARAVWRRVLVPAGRALAATAAAVWRWLVLPVGRALVIVGRELAAALGHAWRVAGHVSLAVGRFLRALLRWTVAEPARWTYRRVLTPLGHLVRDGVLRPAAEAARGAGRVVRHALATARDTARQARADLRRALFGGPGKRPEAVRREPGAGEARTLERSTTALTKD
ncbi:integral membrane protein [Streptomyces griseoaurantiacus M045]|uniref:Integral membrane protein n=1 Tax=Streptomyces griseoaurantiacus M045 TaxID=996637 RepID=F3NAF7_9ACTN|nr:hypothetical protein [Streptomyces griseoaurantiacus]EGG49266.1 integral membrane protein [Streptomyces griseoaurantiacus M045]